MLNKKYILILLLIGVLLIIFYEDIDGGSNQSVTSNSNSQDLSHAKSLADQAKIELLMSDVRWLADDKRQGRASGTDAEDEVGQWIAQRYEFLNLEAFRRLELSDYAHTFNIVSDKKNTGTKDIRGENIIGVIPGASHPDQYVIVSAHYDHLGVKEDLIYNGADDDATGVAAILEIARIFSQSGTRLAQSLVFIAFSGEEIGRQGSEALCEDLSSHHVAGNWMGLNLEMLGAVQGKGTYINIWKQNNKLTQPIIAAVKTASTEVDFPMIVSEGLDPGSDARELLECKVATTTMDVGGGEAFHDNHPYYHSPDDEPQHIDQEGFLKAVQVATIAIWKLANDVSK